MAKSKHRRIWGVVRGVGAFPTDMLRFDRCYPATQSDAVTIDEGTSLRFVMIQADRDPGQQGFTPMRWISFGWELLTETENCSEASETKNRFEAEQAERDQADEALKRR